ncbi:Ff.00g026760.m01.CDS01 [Fusarium sp. VM40]|nr:Ff.00g026760.m01.CDS01 [Fusarium sp. VM40]
MASSWRSLPPEIRLLVLRCIIPQYRLKETIIDRGFPRASLLTTVSKEWQEFFERETFRRMDLEATDLYTFSRTVLADKPESATTVTQNNRTFTQAMAVLLKTLSSWEGHSGGLTLEIRAHSPSDQQFHGNLIQLYDDYPLRFKDDPQLSTTFLKFCRRNRPTPHNFSTTSFELELELEPHARSATSTRPFISLLYSLFQLSRLIMAALAPTNPLLSTQKSSELQAVLHPLVLLTISEYITRHTLRSQAGPIIGVLLGQQNGREITIEHAFEAHTRQEPSAQGGYLLDADRFGARLEQMTTVHKDRQLDLVGWYTLLPSSGPTPTILPIHNQILTGWNESALLLGFHPEQVVDHSVGGKLPLTIYESNYEVDDPKADNDGEDKKMGDGEPLLKLKFRELPYSVETDETEMISMNYVAASGGNATAAAPKDDKPSLSIESNGKGKRRLVESQDEDNTKDSVQEEEITLTPEEDEMIAALTAKANAIKMLQSRINLLTTYLERLPPAYLDPNSFDPSSMDADNTIPSVTVLRKIQALVSRLDLVIPSDRASFDREMLHEANDVNLVRLLNGIVQNLGQARDVGRKFHVVETAKASNRRGAMPGPGQDIPIAPSAYNIRGAGDLLM